MIVPQCWFCVSRLPSYCISIIPLHTYCVSTNYTHLYIQYMWHRLVPESGILHCFNSRLTSHDTLHCTTITVELQNYCYIL